jgi:hypothetical protein
MEPNIFINELVGKAGGILISDIIDGEQVLFLGKSNIPKRTNEFEGFGGKWEPEDISSLHTALREMIEEFFNIKTNTEFINKLALDVINANIIIKRIELYGMSYLINLSGLDFIFIHLTEFDNTIKKYKTVDNKFNYKEYIKERIISDIPANGINEIKSIILCKLSDIKNNSYDLRWFTSKIIYEMLIKPNKKVIKL